MFTSNIRMGRKCDLSDLTVTLTVARLLELDRLHWVFLKPYLLRFSVFMFLVPFCMNSKKSSGWQFSGWTQLIYERDQRKIARLFGGDYKAMVTQITNIEYCCWWTWQWVLWTSVTSSFTKSESNWTSLECCRVGDLQHVCAADKYAESMWLGEFTLKNVYGYYHYRVNHWLIYSYSILNLVYLNLIVYW